MIPNSGFLLFSLFSAWLSFNLYRPVYHSKTGAVISCAFGLASSELAFHTIFLEAVCILLFVSQGGVSGLSGLAGLVFLAVSWIYRILHYSRSKDTRDLIESSLKLELGEAYSAAPPLLPEQSATTPVSGRLFIDPLLSLRQPASIECLKDIVYAQSNGIDLRLDIRRHASSPQNSPVLIQIHGGAWTEKIGSKNGQALPLMNRLSEHGWVCVAVEYRLSPQATFPDHIIDCKKALAWVKQHIHQYGGNRDFIVVTGGSAGGHLCSLLALTPNHVGFQPGFEHVNTNVQGCVSFYGLYDLYNANQWQKNNGLELWLEKLVMKVTKEKNPEIYQQASPINHIHRHAPPFMVVQGTSDTIVSLAEGKYFINRLKKISLQPAIHIEIPGAQHGFDLLSSLRSELTIQGVELFLNWIYRQHQKKKMIITT